MSNALVDVILVFIGLAGLSYYVWAAILAQRARHWPTVEGTVTQSAISAARAELSWYRLELQYDYEVSGSSYTGGRVFFGDLAYWTLFRGFVTTRHQRYKVGERVRVYYNPQRPQQAVLEPGVWPGEFVGALIFAVALVIGLWAGLKS